MRRLPLSRSAPAALALGLLLAGCGGGGGGTPSTTTTTPTATEVAPVVTPPVAAGAYSVNRCINQVVVPGNPGQRVADLVVPDTLQVDFAKPNGFPNGRQLTDPVIDVTLAIIFLDMTKHAPDVLAKVPVNPAANDVRFRDAFPYLAAPQGNPPLPPAGGTNFNFRTDSVTAYTRVDRMGMPAVATALISSASKSGYNDDNPGSDLTGKWVPDIASTLGALAGALQDDFTGLGLSICAVKQG